MGFLRVTRNESFYATHILLRLRLSPIAVRFVLDESLDNGQLMITKTTPRFGGITLHYSLNGTVLDIESNESNSNLRVSNTGDAVVSGGGIANTGIMLGSTTPSAEDVSYSPVPLEYTERVMQFRSPANSLDIAFGPGEYSYAII